MAVNLSPVGGVAAQFFDNSGNVLTGGKIYTYTAGTTTPQVTYTSATGVTAHSNPIILDASGRVPSGEIWLTDGLSYKFLIKTSTEVLIGTYDNVIGINSNFINFLTETEIQTATAGQTVFTLTTTQYQPGTNSLSVFVDGVNQYDGVSYSYVETDSVTVTFTAGLHVGALVKFTTAQTLSSGVTDASLVTYDPPFTGSVPTNVEVKLSETVSVMDFGAVGDGVTDNLAAITAAIAASSGKTIQVPVDTAGGDYAITSGTLTIPVTARFEYEAGARIYANGGTIVDAGRHFYLFSGGAGEGQETFLARGFAVELNGGNTGTAPASTFQYNRIRIVGDTADAEPDANGTKVDGLLVQHNFGGVGTKGGRHAIEGILSQDAITEATNPDRNYVGVVGLSTTTVGDGGGPLVADFKGGYFGGNFVASNTGGKFLANLTAAEFNTNTSAQGGEGVHIHYGIQIVANHKERGYTRDAAIGISNKSASTTTYRDGIRFGSSNGAHPLGVDSRVLLVEEQGGVRVGFEIPECSESVLLSGNVNLKNNQLTIAAANSNVSLGDPTVANNPAINFLSSGLAAGYDSRILASGGTATTGAGVLALQAGNVQLTASSEIVTSGTVRPIGDGVNSLGRADRRWSVVYAATGTINTSDANQKTQIRDITAQEKAVALRVKSQLKAFKFKSAVEQKVENARIHFGVIAQDVKAAFEAEGLVAEHYGVFCSDIGENGSTTLGVRYDELFAFVLGAM